MVAPSRNARHVDDSAALESTGMMRWLLTYADMITLLLILFVILFAISTISPKKFETLEQGIVPAFNAGQNPVSPGGVSLLKNPSLNTHLGNISIAALQTALQSQGSASQVANNTSTAQATSQTNPQTAQQLTPAQASASAALATQIEQALAAQGLSQDVSVTVQSEGVVVQVLADKVYFATDIATLDAKGLAITNAVAGVVAGYPNDIVVEGYTDNQPIIGGPFPTNLDLSAQRAISVALQLESDGISPNRLTLRGFGENAPVAANNDSHGNPIPANQALNRRIDIVVLNSGAPGSSAAPAAAGSTGAAPPAPSPPPAGSP